MLVNVKPKLLVLVRLGTITNQWPSVTNGCYLHLKQNLSNYATKENYMYIKLAASIICSSPPSGKQSFVQYFERFTTVD